MFAQHYRKQWMKEMAESRIPNLHTKNITSYYEGTTYDFEQLTLLQHAIRINLYDVVWLFVDRFEYNVDVQADPLVGTTLLHTVATYRLRKFDDQEYRNFKKLVDLCSKFDQ